MKMKYHLEGLDCANCAQKIEHALSKMDGVMEVHVDVMTQTLQLEITQDALIENILARIQEIDAKITIQDEEDINLTFYIEGLDCANCAQKIETYVQQIEHVVDASLQFSNGVLHVQCPRKDKQAITKHIIDVVPTMEHGIQIYEEKQNEAKKDYEMFAFHKQWKLYVGCVLFGIACVFHLDWLCIIAYLIAGFQVLKTACMNIRRKEVFDEHFLMSIATLGAMLLKEYHEAVAVMLFYEIGELFQSYAVQRSKTSISSLMDLRSDVAHVLIDEKIVDVSLEEVKKESIIVIKPGERIPLDGYVVEGVSSIDTAALTGESLPVEVQEDDEVLAGCINLQGVLKVRVEKEYAQSQVARILDLVEHASAKKAPLEKFISRFARIYTPIVVCCAVVLAIVPAFLFDSVSFSMMCKSALTFLVVSCPCALVVSIPLGLFAGIGSASKKGILIKGGTYLEALQDVDTIVFDKTGTLTKGTFEIDHIQVYHQTKEVLLSYAAYAEAHSTHPLAVSIRQAYAQKIDVTKIETYEERTGFGVYARVDGKEILVGNYKLMKEEHISCVEVDEVGTILYVACDHEYLGYICMKDVVKSTSKKTIASLRKLGVQQMVLLTGDRKEVGESVGTYLGLDAVYTQLLPKDKLEKVEAMYEHHPSHKKIMFVGDGMNDAPVLARVDIGVAMGKVGSDAAVEAADIVLMKDDPSALLDAMELAKYTMRILKQNIVLSLVIKIGVMILAVLGIANMWMGVFADVGVTILAIANAMRILRF